MLAVARLPRFGQLACFITRLPLKGQSLGLSVVCVQLSLLNFLVALGLGIVGRLRERPGRRRRRGASSAVMQRALLAVATVAATLAFALFVRASTPLDALRGLFVALVFGWGGLVAGGVLRSKNLEAGASLVATLALLLAPPTALRGGMGFEGVVLSFHVAAALMGQLLAVAAAGAALLYLAQKNALKKRSLNLPRRLPALDRIEASLLLTLWTGFLYLSAALMGGALYLSAQPSMESLFAPTAYRDKLVWALGVWVWYAAILCGRHIGRWTFTRVARMSLLGLVLLSLSIFGLSFFRAEGG